MKELIIDDIEKIRLQAAEFISTTGIGCGSSECNIFAFEGVMGVGKTTFIKAICEELGVENVINSPTFSIINEYQSATTGLIIYHFDFYRISNLNEVLDLGIEEYFDSGNICFIEWPEIIQPFLPENTIFVSITEQSDGRRKISYKDS